MLLSLAIFPSLVLGLLGDPCNPFHSDDFSTKACQGWCNEDYADSHCRFCKCQGCDFCPEPAPPSPVAPPDPPVPPPPPWRPGREGGPLRLTARGTELVDSAGQTVVLQGVNMYLEWYAPTTQRCERARRRSTCRTCAARSRRPT